MNSIKLNNSSEFQKSGSKKLLYYITALVCIFMASAVSIILLNRIVIGGANYKTVKNNTDAIENIALINSNLYQILNEVRPIMHDTDKGSAITITRLLTIDNDRRFVTLQELIKSSGRKEIVNKVDITWKEYKKTLMEEIIPAAAKGDKLKIAYLTTGIQTQRFNSMNKNLTNLTVTLRQDISQTEQLAVSDKTINNVITGLLTFILLGMLAYFYRINSEQAIKPLQSDNQQAENSCDEKPDISTLSSNAIITVEHSDSTIKEIETEPDTISKISEAAEVLSIISNSLSTFAILSTTCNSTQEKAIIELSEQHGRMIPSARLLSDNLEKLASYSAENQTSTIQHVAKCRETVLKANSLESATDQLQHAVSETAVTFKNLHDNISSLQNTAGNIVSSTVYMDAGIKLVHFNALECSTFTDGFRKDAEKSQLKTEDAISSIQEIRLSSQITTEAIERISLKTRNIINCIRTIKEVTEQIHLLSLNAAVIAAQAGDHGSDFAVVADEIRGLTEQSGNSTREISSIIRDIQHETSLTVDCICKVEANIARSEHISKCYGLELDNIASAIQQTNSLTQAISNAALLRSNESHALKEEISNFNNMLESIAVSIENQFRESEEMTTPAELIKELATDLNSIIHDQLNSITTFSAVSEAVVSLTDAIKETGNDLNRQCDEMTESIHGIQESIATSITVSESIENTIVELSKQIEILKEDASSQRI